MGSTAVTAGAAWHAYARGDTISRDVLSLPTMKTELTEQILCLQPGDHLGAFYDGYADQMSAMVPFVQQALQCDEQFVYVADDHTVEELTQRLERAGVGVKEATDRGRLKLQTGREWRYPESFAGDEKAAQVRAFVDQAAVAGFKGLRVAVEMTSALGPAVETGNLEKW